MANYNLESISKTPAVENNSRDSAVKFFDEFQKTTQSESKMTNDFSPTPLSKCGDTAKCYLPPSESILSGRDNRQANITDRNDDQSRRRDLTRESDQLMARGMERSLLMGNVTDFGNALKSLSENPQRAERVLQELREQLAKKDIELSFQYGQDVYGKTNASIHMLKRNDWSKSSGYTTFTYSTNGRMMGEHKPTGDILKPAQGIDPRIALNTIIFSDRGK